MLQETLKQATKQNHDELEQLMYVQHIMGGTLTLQQYKEILTTNYIVHQVFENELYNNVSPELFEKLQLNKRKKLNALLADMHEMQMEIPVTDSLPHVSFEKNDAEILGALYVLEGATLGGSVIVKKLKTNPHLNNLNLVFHYYQVYEDDLIPHWKSFCEILNQQPEDTFEKSVAGAQKMFSYIAATQQNVTAQQV